METIHVVQPSIKESRAWCRGGFRSTKALMRLRAGPSGWPTNMPASLLTAWMWMKRAANTEPRVLFESGDVPEL